MASENIMMSAVKKGGDRQQLHEKLRVHSLAAAKNVKELGLENDLIDRVCADKSFQLDRAEVESILKPINFVGRSVEQVEEYIAQEVAPKLKKYQDVLGEKAELSV